MADDTIEEARMTDEMAGSLLNAYLEYEVPHGVDLWPAVRARLIERQGRQRPVGRAPRVSQGQTWTWRRGLLPWAAVALAAALAFGIVLSPTARAEFLGRIQRYWFAVLSNPTDRPLQTDEIAPRAGQRVALVSLADAEHILGIHLPQPQSLPANFELMGVNLESADAAALMYAPRQGGSSRLVLRVSKVRPQGGDEVAESDVKAVLVNGHPGLVSEEGDVPGEISSRSVTWEADGLVFLLTGFGLISRDELLTAAESVRDH